MVIVAKPKGMPASVGATQNVSPPLVLSEVSWMRFSGIFRLYDEWDIPCEPE